MNTLYRLEQYRVDYRKWLRRKATDPLVVEPDRKQFAATYQRFVDDIRKQVEAEMELKP